MSLNVLFRDTRKKCRNNSESQKAVPSDLMARVPRKWTFHPCFREFPPEPAAFVAMIYAETRVVLIAESCKRHRDDTRRIFIILFVIFRAEQTWRWKFLLLSLCHQSKTTRHEKPKQAQNVSALPRVSLRVILWFRGNLWGKFSSREIQIKRSRRAILRIVLLMIVGKENIAIWWMGERSQRGEEWMRENPFKSCSR